MSTLDFALDLDLGLDLDLDLGAEAAAPPIVAMLPSASASAPAPVPAPAQPAQATPQAERAQAIDCGGLGVVVPYTWARSVVEQFDITTVPNAPTWLAGAANVDGRIVAVVDLAHWATPGAPATPAVRSRLLLGGEGDHAFALRFNGLPALVRIEPTAALSTEVPPALAPYITAEAAAHGNAGRWPVVDMAALGRAWAAELVL